ncbi:MAG: Acinetobacter phage, partial [Pseudomonadota bacterium]
MSIRIPAPYDTAAPQLQPAHGVAQIDERVAGRIGDAGRSMGNAIAAIGAAFGEVAAKSEATNDATNFARAKLDFYKFDNDAWTGLQNDVSQDGSGYEKVGDIYSKGASDILAKYPVSNPQKREQLSMFIEHQIASRGFQAARAQQGMRAKYYQGIEDQEISGAAARVEANPSQETVDALRSPLHEMVDAGLGKYSTQAQVEARKQQIEGALLMAQYRGLLKTDPEAASELMRKIREGKYEIDRTPQQVGGIPQPGASTAPSGDLKIEPSPYKVRDSWGFERSQPIKGMVVHHTEGATTLEGNVSWANQKGTGANYYVDKEGKVFQVADDKRGSIHIRDDLTPGGKRPDFKNGNTLSVEIITGKNEQPNDKQLQAAEALVRQKSQQYGFDVTKDVYGHEELNPGHRKPTEGMGVVSRLRAGPVGQPANDTGQPAKEVSQSGVDFIKQQEGWKPKAYADGAQTSVGWGTRGQPGETITSAEGERRLKGELSEANKVIDAQVKVPLSQNQRDALVSYVFNAGPNGKAKEVFAAINAGDAQKAAEIMKADDKGGVVANRRDAEVKMFLGGPSPQEGQQQAAQPSSEGLRSRAITFGMSDQSQQPQPQQGQQPQQGGNVSDLVGRLSSEDPNTPISSMLTKEQMAGIAQKYPELAQIPNIENATIGDVVKYASAARQEAGGDLGDLADQAMTASRQSLLKRGDEFIPLGRLQGGQVFSVKSKFGEIKVPAEAVNALDKNLIRKMQADAKEQLGIRQKEGESIAEDMIRKELLTQETQGKSHAEFDPRVLQEIYRKNPKKVADFERKLSIAKSVYGVMQDAPNVPIGVLEDRLDQLRESVVSDQGADPDVQAAVDRTARRISALDRVRKADPGRAVDGATEVVAVKNMLPGGEPKNTAHLYALADARIKAEVRLGLVQYPIRKDEALKMMAPIISAPQQDKRRVAMSVAEEIGKRYGDLAE